MTPEPGRLASAWPVRKRESRQRQPRRWQRVRNANRLLAILGFVVFACASADAAVRIDSIRVGFDGHWKVGYWTPVEIEFNADEPAAGRVVVTAPDGDGVPMRTIGEPRELPPGKSSVMALVKPGRRDAALTVTLEYDGKSIVEREFGANDFPPGLLSTQELILTVGAAGFDIPPDRQNLTRTVVANLEDISQFPNDWRAFETVDAVILLTGQPEWLTSIASTDPRLNALSQWIEMGGRLVLSAGSKAEQVFASGSPLLRFVPGEFQDMAPLRRSGILESFAQTTEPLPSTGLGGANVLRVPRLTSVQGTIEAYEGASPTELPVVIRSPVGFGQVVFIGLELETSPIADWAAKGRLLNLLLGKPAQPWQSEGDERIGRVTHSGYSDLAGQLRSAMDQFSGVALIPFWQIAAILTIYVVLIGPGDYFLLRRFGKPELTWLTFPLLVLLFSAGAAVWAWTGKGNQLRLNQVDVVDVDVSQTAEAGGALARGTSWMTIYSPRTDRYNLRVQESAGVAPRDVLLSWMGLPGSAIGGMDGSGAGQTLFREPYSLSTQSGVLTDVPIAAWSSKAFSARWRADQAPAISVKLSTSSIHAEVVVGTILNRLDAPLTDCYLLYDRWAYPLGTIKAGEQVTIDADSPARTVETFLTQRRIEPGGGTPRGYDAAGVDVKRIVQMLMFHDAAGGQKFTQLLNRYEHAMDLSGHLHAGRAILLATGPAAAPVEIDRQSVPDANRSHTTFYRFVLPVQQTRIQ